LRQEAEWLLRSHQTRQRTLREADKVRKNNRRTDSVDPEEEPLPFMVDDVSPSPGRSASSAQQRRIWVGLLAVFIVTMAGWSIFGQGGTWLRGLWSRKIAPAGQTETARTDRNTPTNNAATPKVITSTQSGLILTPTAPISVTPSLTPDIPNNLVQKLGTPEPLAAITPRSAVDVVDTKLFDLKSFLLQKQNQELAQLEVSATLQGTTLKLKGIVPMDAQRRALIDLAQNAPDVTAVDAVDLLVRLPPTYTVQEGDTLWDITFKLYGDVGRMPALIQANTDVLASPEALRIGMQLKVPSNQ
jgi:nucleoid-associated protein YgaU